MIKIKKIIKSTVVYVVEIGIMVAAIYYGYYLDKMRKKEIEELTVLENM